MIITDTLSFQSHGTDRLTEDVYLKQFRQRGKWASYLAWHWQFWGYSVVAPFLSVLYILTWFISSFPVLLIKHWWLPDENLSDEMLLRIFRAEWRKLWLELRRASDTLTITRILNILFSLLWVWFSCLKSCTGFIHFSKTNHEKISWISTPRWLVIWLMVCPWQKQFVQKCSTDVVVCCCWAF